MIGLVGISVLVLASHLFECKVSYGRGVLIELLLGDKVTNDKRTVSLVQAIVL